MRLLVAEDEKDLCRIISKHLTAAGYAVDSCYNGQEALDYLLSSEYDGAVFDVMMPKLDGFSAVRKLREMGNNTPVLFLTAKDSVSSRVEGLDLGGNDYLIKPFSFDELLARIRAMTRKQSGNPTSTFRCADLELDEATHTVTRSGNLIELSMREFAVLSCLIQNKGKVVSRDTIENSVWNFDWEGGTNVVDVYMSYLRRKVDTGYDNKLIHTVRGAGWVLKEEA